MGLDNDGNKDDYSIGTMVPWLTGWSTQELRRSGSFGFLPKLIKHRSVSRGKRDKGT
jgi:hypothetical protein